MAPKESKKGWEKERRNRLNIAFDNLGKLLPCFDPSIKLSKIEILEKTTIYIDELNNKLNKPLNNIKDDVDKEEAGAESKKLYERLNKLLSRNELLNNLLKNAGIKPPREYGFKKISPTKKWSQKITPNLAKILAQKEAQKENKPIKRKRIFNKNRTVQKVPILKNKRTNVKLRRNTNSSKNKSTVRSSDSNLVPVTNMQPCYFISNGTSNGIKNLIDKSKKVVATSLLIPSNAKHSSQILSASIPTINTLPSTTILLTNNNIPTILPQPIFQNTPFVVKPNLPTYILVATTQSNNTNQQNFSSAVSDSSKVDVITKSLAPIRPKKRNVTTTTQINKVPIPALTSSYCSNYFVLANNDVASNKITDKKACSKKLKRALKDESKVKIIGNESKKSKISPENINKESLPNKMEKGYESNENNIVDQKENEILNPDLVLETSSKKIENVAELKVQQRNTATTENQLSDSTKSFVNVTSNILVSASEIPQASDTEKETLAKNVDMSNLKSKDQTEIAVSLKDTSSNIITDKELLSSIKNTTDKDIETIVNQTELSNDLFATLQVPTGSQNPESTSPTAAFLNAFPLVSSKIQEVLEDETSDSRRDTPTLLQIGTMDITKTSQTVTVADNLTPSLMNLDNFAFFNAKDIYQPFDNIVVTTAIPTEASSASSNVSTAKIVDKSMSKISKDARIIYEQSNISTYNVSTVKSSSSPSVIATQSTRDVSIQNHDNNISNVAVKQNLTNSSNSSKTDSTTSKLHISQAKASINLAKKNLLPSTATTTSNSISIINSSSFNQMYYTSVTSTMQSSASAVNYHSNKVKASPEKYSKCNAIQHAINAKSSHINECNTLNPFTDMPKTNSNCSYNVATTKSCSDIYGTNSNCHYNYQTDFSTNFSGTANKQYYNKETNQTGRYYGYDNYDSYKSEKFDSNNFVSTATNYYPDKSKYLDQQKQVNKIADVVPKAPVNWMTTPDLKQAQINTDFILFPTNKDSDPPQIPSYSQNSFGNNSSQNTYFNPSTALYPTISTDYNIIPDPKKHFDLSFQRNDHEEHQINWSPSKHVNLDSSHNFGALPTLEGDLALGTQGPYLEPKLTPKKDLNYKYKDARRNLAPNFETSSANFLSVSQFIEPCPKPTEVAAKVSNRRNSGGRIKSNNNQSITRNKRTNNKTASEVANKDNSSYSSKSIGKNQSNHQYKPVHNNHNQTQNTFIPDHNMWLSSSTNNPRVASSGNNQASSSGKNVYTAESLISHQHHPQTDATSHTVKPARSTNQQYNYHRSLPTPSFLSDNIMPYFPTMDVPSQDNANQHNQTYVGTNSFPAASFPVSIQNSYNNNYNLTTPSIGTNYLQPPNYLPDLGNHDYGLLSDNIFSHTSTSNVKSNENKQFNKTTAKVSSTNTKSETHQDVTKKNLCNFSTNSNNLQSSHNTKKSKRKQTSEVTPNLSNIDFGFLSTMPASINSPILPDDFHTNFLPPPPNPHQLYPCKTPLYGTKQSSDLTAGNLLPLPPVTRSQIQHPEISPSNNIGPTLTNFNLSTILKY